MFGGNWSDNNPAPQTYYKDKPSQPQNRNSQGSGIIPNSIHKLFEDSQGKNLTFYCSLLQIYNENLYDLLQDPRRDKALKIRENKLYGIFVEGLAEFVVESAEDCYLLLEKGDKNRAVRQTRFNHHSSRSHTIFQVMVESDKANKRGVMKKAKINFCDLAGSEKYDKENRMETEHVRELTQINKSLCMLGKVIHVLGAGADKHVPYRDSKLTRLLQDSLAVSTRTILIATVSPANVYVEETISTLKFADRAKHVMVKVKKNEISANNNQLITKLQREIQHLKNLLNLKRNGGLHELEQKIWTLTQENQKLKTTRVSSTVAEVESLKQENKQLRLELQRAGLSNTLDDVDSTPKSMLANPLHKDVNYEEVPLKPSSGHILSLNQLPKFCSFCKTVGLCVHSSIIADPKNFSLTSSRQNVTNRSTNSTVAYSERAKAPDTPIKLNFRYKLPNALVENDVITAELKEIQQHKKEMQQIKTRLSKIAEIETYRKQQFKKEMQDLEDKRKKDEESAKKKTEATLKKRKELETKKKLIQDFKRTQKIEELTSQALAAVSAQEAEALRIQKNQSNKKKLLEYYSKKRKLESPEH